MESSSKYLSQVVKNNIPEQLLSMARTIRTYFRQPNRNNTWIRNPFFCDMEKTENLTKQEQDELIDLMNNGTIKNIFNDKNYLIFG